MQKVDGNFTMMMRRRTTGILMAVVMVTLWVVQGWPLRIGIALLSLMSVWEVYGAFQNRGIKPLRWGGMAFAGLLVPVYLLLGRDAFLPMIAFFILLTFAATALKKEADYETTHFSIFPIVYPGLFVAMIMPLQDLASPMLSTVALGQAFLIALMNDLAAYEIGVKFGKRKLAPSLSPKKTVEGAIGGMVASVLFAVLIPLVAELTVLHIPYFAPYKAEMPAYWQCAILGLLGGAAAQAGDLAASMLKRFCGVKDFGTIFPGHGGMLDRMDSVLGTAVVVHIFYLFIAL